VKGSKAGSVTGGLQVAVTKAGSLRHMDGPPRLGPPTKAVFSMSPNYTFCGQNFRINRIHGLRLSSSFNIGR
jgi:hypothetical protein